MNRDPLPSADEPRGRPPAAPRSNTAGRLIIGAAGGLAIVAAALLVAVIIRAASPDVARQDPSMSPSDASVSSTAPAASNESVSATPSPTPTPEPLVTDAWAQVETDALNVRQSASIDADIIGRVEHGDLVYLHPAEPITTDSFTWYEVQAGPDLHGWAAGAGRVDVLLTQPANGTRTWCGEPDNRVLEVANAGVELAPVGTFAIGGLELPPTAFTPFELGAAEVAWATGEPICAEITVAESMATDATLRGTLTGCGIPGAAGYPGWLLEVGEPTVSPEGERGRRVAVLHEAVLGFEGGLAWDRIPPLGQALNLALSFRTPACVSLTFADENVAASRAVETVVCGFIANVEGDRVFLADRDPASGATGGSEIRIPAGTRIDGEFVLDSFAELTIIVDDQSDVPMEITLVTTAGC